MSYDLRVFHGDISVVIFRSREIYYRLVKSHCLRMSWVKLSMEDKIICSVIARSVTTRSQPETNEQRVQ